MSVLRVVSLMRLLAPGRLPLVFRVMWFVFLFPVSLYGVVAQPPVRAVAIVGGQLMPGLAEAFRSRGFETVDGTGDEGANPLSGILVVRVSAGPGEGRRVVLAPPFERIALYPIKQMSAFETAIQEAVGKWNGASLRKAGLSLEDLWPARARHAPGVVLGGEREGGKADGVDPGARVMELAYDALPDRRVALVLGQAALLAGTLGIIGLRGAGALGRLEGLTGSRVRPAEVVLAACLIPGIAIAASLAAILPVACAAAWAIGLPFAATAWPIPPLAGIAGVILAAVGTAGSTFARGPFAASVLGTGAVSAAMGLAYLPRLASVMGIDWPWVHAVPFSGLVVWACGGEVAWPVALASAVSTSALAAVGFAVAARRVGAGLYLRRDL